MDNQRPAVPAGNEGSDDHPHNAPPGDAGTQALVRLSPEQMDILTRLSQWLDQVEKTPPGCPETR